MRRANVYKALFADALFQILDNWVFRILCALTLVPVLFTLIVAFEPDEVSFLFGFKSWRYDALLELLGPMSGAGNVGTIDDPQGIVIAAFLSLVFDFFAGSIGVIFCIAATAFFVPRMIEKGAADVLFHKPVSRLVLYVSRYVAGLMYIVLLSTVMVGGIWAGLAVVSGYNDPGILTAALTLTYFFGLIHAVSMLIGVVTRSTVAAILLSILFFFGNGCIHQIWIGKEQLVEGRRLERLAAANDDADEAGDAADVEAELDDDDGAKDVFVRALVAMLDTLHYVLPKTTDASYLAKRMRKAVNRPDFRDDETAFAIYDLPSGFEEVPPAALAAPPFVGDPTGVLGAPIFAAADGESSIGLWRRDRRTEEYEHGGKSRTRRESLSRAADVLAEALTVESPARVDERFGTSSRGSALGGETFLWTADGQRRSATVLRLGEAVLTLVVSDARSTADTPAEATLLVQLSQRSGLDIDLTQKVDWYEGMLGFDSELKYNILFSIGSSLAFTVLMLGIGWWKLRRIDF